MLAKAVSPWLVDSNLTVEDWTVESEPVSKRFEIQVKCQRAYAARRVGQALGALRLPGRNAGWRRIFAPAPMGGGEVEVSCSGDKSPKMVAREVGAKKISKAR